MEDTGVYSRKALIRSGLSQADINELVQRGMFFSVIRGWYAVPEADRHLIEALQTGTRIGCLTGCRYHSLWTPRNAGLHLTYRDGPKPTRPSRATIHRYNHPLPESVVWPLHDCLLHVLRNHDLETSLIVIESAINKALLTFAEARELIGNGPKRTHHLAGHLHWSQSGSETRVRYFFERRGVKVQTQIQLSQTDRADMLVGDQLIIECDSNAHHSSQVAYENDRRRDLLARDLGYQTIRLSYSQIWEYWASTQQSLLQYIRHRVHRRRRRQT